MGNSENRPRAGTPPQLDQAREILENLLRIEQDRLETAIRIEKERNIVFPETSVIIHDVVKLTEAVYGKVATGKQDAPGVSEKLDLPHRLGRRDRRA